MTSKVGILANGDLVAVVPDPLLGKYALIFFEGSNFGLLPVFDRYRHVIDSHVIARDQAYVKYACIIM